MIVEANFDFCFSKSAISDSSRSRAISSTSSSSSSASPSSTSSSSSSGSPSSISSTSSSTNSSSFSSSIVMVGASLTSATRESCSALRLTIISRSNWWPNLSA
ncbi:MAG: hypothetical protein CXT68_03080 [Methanobacteriota archaeon]|nr:MAG: hypothetical protein CXT68_03080 [Euryarchaeota archaeon]